MCEILEIYRTLGVVARKHNSKQQNTPKPTQPEKKGNVASTNNPYCETKGNTQPSYTYHHRTPHIL